MAQAAAKSVNKVSGCNYVAQDQIWKDHIVLEETSAKRWPNNWNFLTTDYKEIVKDELPKKEKPKRKLSPLIQIRPVTPIEEYIEVLPSPRPYPSTTAQLIGWRSAERQLALDKYGRYARPKGGLVKQLNWPKEAIN
ncbi:uncharacterized protein C20orf85-like [Gigantopelta aegis]|uniref:uncharacterized protein C20orf85-like n=1 Tax=Gigantopelta aegis TaxID=1735272 RepID=UPI001B88E3AA|nr:uncharacterized protein C20orf85-like [Gigantopelta aegis]